MKKQSSAVIRIAVLISAFVDASVLFFRQQLLDDFKFGMRRTDNRDFVLHSRVRLGETRSTEVSVQVSFREIWTCVWQGITSAPAELLGREVVVEIPTINAVADELNRRARNLYPKWNGFKVVERNAGPNSKLAGQLRAANADLILEMFSVGGLLMEVLQVFPNIDRAAIGGAPESAILRQNFRFWVDDVRRLVNEKVINLSDPKVVGVPQRFLPDERAKSAAATRQRGAGPLGSGRASLNRKIKSTCEIRISHAP